MRGTQQELPSASVKPFLKWPGGKRWIARQIAELIRPNLKRRYFEPFLGSGAVFFELSPAEAVLSDVNEDLIGTYLAIRDDPDRVRRELKGMRVSPETYYAVRAATPRLATKRAARFLYLNRTAFGGIYRVNQRGVFNVPYGGGERTHHMLWNTAILTEASRILAGVQLEHGDFERFLGQACSGDVVYCDPTYTVAHDSNGFVRYNEHNFRWEDQERLARAACAARDRGAFVLVSNAHSPSVLRLYSNARVWTLRRKSLVSANIAGRRQVREALIILE